MYQVPDMSLWKGRINPEQTDRLFHQVVQGLDMTHDIWLPDQETKIALLGFCCDEGVRRNAGRAGARKGPDHIRRQLASLAVHYDTSRLGMVDAGNVICNGTNLESSFSLFGTKITTLLENDFIPLVFGGGHETSYPHYTALRKFFASERIGIINFDAHFDMRTYENGPHSGSSFRNILDDTRREGGSFYYLPIGIRPEANVTSLFTAMREANQDFIALHEVKSDWEATLDKVSTFLKGVDAVYITMDMDCFSGALAPGVSAIAPEGMTLHEVRTLLDHVLSTSRVVGADIVELNPEFDQNGITAKLAASLSAWLVHHGFNG